MKRLFFVSLLAGVVAIAPGLRGSQRVAIHVTPAVAMEPASLTIRATVEPSEDNRLLRVMVDSGEYATSSDIPLDGRQSARLNVVELHEAPSGLYEVTAIVSGSRGPIASTVQVVKIQPAPGRRR